MEKQEPKTYRVQVAEFNAEGEIVAVEKELTFRAFLEAGSKFVEKHQQWLADNGYFGSDDDSAKKVPELGQIKTLFHIEKARIDKQSIGGLSNDWLHLFQFVSIEFYKCLFAGVSFTRSHFNECTFTKCIFHGFEFTRCTLLKCKIQNLLSQVNIERSPFDETQTLESRYETKLKFFNSVIEDLSFDSCAFSKLDLGNSVINKLRISNTAISNFHLLAEHIDTTTIDLFTFSRIDKIDKGIKAVNGIILYRFDGESVALPVNLYKSIESGVVSTPDALIENLKHARHVFGVHLVISTFYIIQFLGIFFQEDFKKVNLLPSLGFIAKLPATIYLSLTPLSILVLLNTTILLSGISRSLPFLKYEKDVTRVTNFGWILTQYIERNIYGVLGFDNISKIEHKLIQSRFFRRYRVILGAFLIWIFGVTFGAHIITKLVLESLYNILFLYGFIVPELNTIAAQIAGHLLVCSIIILLFRFFVAYHLKLSPRKALSKSYYGYTDRYLRYISSVVARFLMIFAGPLIFLVLLAIYVVNEGFGYLAAYSSIMGALYILVAAWTFQITQRFQKPLVYEPDTEQTSEIKPRSSDDSDDD